MRPIFVGEIFESIECSLVMNPENQQIKELVKDKRESHHKEPFSSGLTGGIWNVQGITNLYDDETLIITFYHLWFANPPVLILNLK